MPRFVIAELQESPTAPTARGAAAAGAGSTFSTGCARIASVDLQIYDRELPEFAGQPVDLKLVLLAKHLDGKVVTNDYNLNKVARLQGVDVINLNDLANALKPIVPARRSTRQCASSSPAKSPAKGSAISTTAR